MIVVKDLTHYYGSRRAIEGINFQINQNEIIGFLGLNGAGKSTTLKILAGLVVPSAGSVMVDSVDMISAGDAFRSRIGYLPEDPPLYKEMTVTEFIRFCGQLKGMSAAEVDKRLPEVLATCQLSSRAHDVISELSHGYRKRVGIAQAIIHKPGLVILDEPISGLDPRQIVEMRNVIRALAKDCTVLISSHILGEISETCDRLLVLHNGLLAATGTEAELVQRSSARGTRLSLTIRGTKEAIELAIKSTPSFQSMSLQAESEGLWRVNVALGADEREALVSGLVTAKLGIRKVLEDETELEHVFLGLTTPTGAA
jgi:ABC-2 type transport system ATP-binding protein